MLPSPAMLRIWMLHLRVSCSASAPGTLCGQPHPLRGAGTKVASKCHWVGSALKVAPESRASKLPKYLERKPHHLAKPNEPCASCLNVMKTTASHKVVTSKRVFWKNSFQRLHCQSALRALRNPCFQFVESNPPNCKTFFLRE